MVSSREWEALMLSPPDCWFRPRAQADESEEELLRVACGLFHTEREVSVTRLASPPPHRPQILGRPLQFRTRFRMVPGNRWNGNSSGPSLAKRGVRDS